MPSSTDNSDLLVPNKPKTGSLQITSLNPTKVDLPGLEVSTSLCQVSAASSTNTSTIDVPPAASAGATGASQDVSPDQELSDVESIPSWSDKDSEEGEISDSETQEQNEEMNYRETVRAVHAFLT